MQIINKATIFGVAVSLIVLGTPTAQAASKKPSTSDGGIPRCNGVPGYGNCTIRIFGKTYLLDQNDVGNLKSLLDSASEKNKQIQSTIPAK
jgi:hypothetical protein